MHCLYDKLDHELSVPVANLYMLSLQLHVVKVKLLS